MKITTKRATEWTTDLSLRLSLAAVHASLDDLKNQFDSGAPVFWVQVNDLTVGAYMLRFDQLTSGQIEGVVVAGQGMHADIQLFDLVMPTIEQQCRERGCKTLRVHTSRPGVAKKLQRHGFELAEVVTTKKL